MTTHLAIPAANWHAGTGGHLSCWISENSRFQIKNASLMFICQGAWVGTWEGVWVQGGRERDSACCVARVPVSHALHLLCPAPASNTPVLGVLHAPT